MLDSIGALSAGVTDHGALTGLGDDDHTQYLLRTDYTAADVLTKIKTVDGSGSGLDADLLDGHDTAYFATASHNHDSDYVNVTGDTMTGSLTISTGNLSVTAGTIETSSGFQWDLQGYTNGTVTATGYVEVEIDGIVYKLLASSSVEYLSGAGAGGEFLLTGLLFEGEFAGEIYGLLEDQVSSLSS